MVLLSHTNRPNWKWKFGTFTYEINSSAKRQMKNNFDKKKHRAKILKPLKIGDQVQIIKTDHEKSWNILGNTTAADHENGRYRTQKLQKYPF